MGNNIEFNPSAFKHGVTEADILAAFQSKVYEGTLLDFSDKYAIIGFDVAGKPIEVMYNIINSESINVFHAMKCRKGVIKELEKAGVRLWHA